MTENGNATEEDWQYATYMSQLTLDEWRTISHQPKDFIDSCVFNQAEVDSDCDLLMEKGGAEIMVYTYPPLLCYTFNYHHNETAPRPPKLVSQPLTGLELILNLECRYQKYIVQSHWQFVTIKGNLTAIQKMICS